MSADTVARTEANSSQVPVSGSGSCASGREGLGKIDEPAEGALEVGQGRGGRLSVPEGLGEVALHEIEEPLRLPAIDPHDGGDVPLLLGAEVEDGARDLAMDVARIEHQDSVAPHLVPLLRPVEEPELTGYGAGVEEVAADVDHHVHGAALDQLLPHLRLVATGARCLRRHDDAGAAVLVQVAVEIGKPEVVGVRDLLRLVDAGQGRRAGACRP